MYDAHFVSHDTVDFTRDTASAIVGGLVLMAVGWMLNYFRRIRERLARHGIEIRHTQNEAHISPFYPEYPADKL